MTTELEKQFFDVFGIEPYREPSREYNSDGEICSWYIEYPQITDRQLLELICTNNSCVFGQRIIWEEVIIPTSYKYLKESTLKLLMLNIKDYPELKHQVQAIFNGEI